jgi:ATPase subunit of ABC transporter with duplicated ATPase domains
MVILGDGGVGKTTLLRVLKNTEGNANIFNTRKTAFLEVETVKLETDEILFYDLAGTSFRSATRLGFKKCFIDSVSFFTRSFF